MLPSIYGSLSNKYFLEMGGIIVERIDPLIYAKLLPLQLNTWPRYDRSYDPLPLLISGGAFRIFSFDLLLDRATGWFSMAFRASRGLFIGPVLIEEEGILEGEIWDLRKESRKESVSSRFCLPMISRDLSDLVATLLSWHFIYHSLNLLNSASDPSKSFITCPHTRYHTFPRQSGIDRGSRNVNHEKEIFYFFRFYFYHCKYNLSNKFCTICSTRW